jgi:hypothetical protein
MNNLRASTGLLTVVVASIVILAGLGNMHEIQADNAKLPGIIPAEIMTNEFGFVKDIVPTMLEVTAVAAGCMVPLLIRYPPVSR